VRTANNHPPGWSAVVNLKLKLTTLSKPGAAAVILASDSLCLNSCFPTCIDSSGICGTSTLLSAHLSNTLDC